MRLADKATGEAIGTAEDIRGAVELVRRAEAIAALEVELAEENLERKLRPGDGRRMVLGLVGTSLRSVGRPWSWPAIARLILSSATDWSVCPCPNLLSELGPGGDDEEGRLARRLEALWNRPGRGGLSGAEYGQIAERRPTQK